MIKEMDKSKFLMALGKRIKSLRTAQNISQQALAGICNFEKANMSRIENGGTNPTVLTLLKISKALNISLAELLDDEDLKNSSDAD
jgi:transcriptional regulator with XRE-family HTH domain